MKQKVVSIILDVLRNSADDYEYRGIKISQYKYKTL